MSSLRTPPGPVPQSVYWRRRIVLLLGLIAVVAIIVLIVVRPGSAHSQDAKKDANPPAAAKSTVTGPPTDGATPGASGSAAPSDAATGAAASDVKACKPSAVKVVAVTDATSYAAGVQPKLSMSITNSGSSACSYDVGTGAQVYTITSGSDTIWKSTDCQTGPTSTVQTLEPGKTLTTQPISWDRTRSSTSTCSGTRPAVGAGGASYHLGVALGKSTSASTKQFILN